MADSTGGAHAGGNPWLMAAANVIGCLPLIGLVVAIPLLLIWAITTLPDRMGGQRRGSNRSNGPDRTDPAP